MENEISKLVSEILQINNCTNTDTSEFKNLSHNKDLVPRYKKNFDKLIHIIGTYYNDCYDIQGVNDDGVDVLLKYLLNDEKYRIGFQIKSYHDIKEKNWQTILESQLFKACGKWKIDDLYVVFCTDSIEHKDKLRNGIAEIEKSSDCEIHIVEPENALTFYNFNSVDIFSTIYNFFHKNDSRLQRARKCIEGIDSDEKKFLIQLIIKQFVHNDETISLSGLEKPNCLDLVSLMGSPFYDFDIDTDLISYSYENNWDLTSFVIEAKTNFDFSDSQLKAFLFKCLI